MKKKSIFTLIFSICFIIPAMFMLTACGVKEANDGGSVDGGSVEEKSVVGSWETYQMIVPAKNEGEQDTIVNVGEEFEGVVLSKDTFELTLEDDMSLKFTQTVGSMSMNANSTCTNNDGVYFAELVIQLGGDEHTLYLQFTYDKDNDRISCALQEKDVETGEYTTGFNVIFSRANG